MSAARFEPAQDAIDVPVVFLVNEGSGIPALAVALQTLGKGMIIAEGMLSEDSIVRTQRRKMPDDVEVQLRLSEVIRDDGTGGLAPDFVVPPRRPNDNEDKALRAAVEFARSPKQYTSVPRPRLPVVVRSSIDKPYADMPYPEAGYRVLAAFRIWSVIEYFFPYKDLMNADWGAVLREFMQRFEAANNAQEYQFAVTEMMSHLHDSHVGVTSPVLDKIFGALSPVGLRWIEDSAVVTGFLDEDAANKSGIQVGDVILTVNGEDVRGRLERLKKYVSASTPGRLLSLTEGIVSDSKPVPALTLGVIRNS